MYLCGLGEGGNGLIHRPSYLGPCSYFLLCFKCANKIKLKVSIDVPKIIKSLILIIIEIKALQYRSLHVDNQITDF